MLATLVGIGRITRPEPMIWALVSVEDGLRPVGHELHSPCHKRIVQGDGENVKLSRQIPTVAETLFIPPLPARREREEERSTQHLPSRGTFQTT